MITLLNPITVKWLVRLSYLFVVYFLQLMHFVCYSSKALLLNVVIIIIKVINLSNIILSYNFCCVSTLFGCKCVRKQTLCIKQYLFWFAGLNSRIR